MKKSILVIFACLSAVLLYAQQINRDKVIVEIATGTWCGYCPGAAMGADDLVANGHDVGIIENHNGDPFANNYSNARNTYYGVTGYPTAVFDGLLKVIGGNATQSMYPQYLARYNQRIGIPSSFSIMVFGEHNGLDYNIKLVAQKVDSTPSQHMVIHLALTESEIPYSWQNQSELNFVNRLMAPNQNGTNITFASSDMEIIDLNFSMNASWKPEHCELVVFIQDTDTKEILQGTKVALDDLQAPPLNNVEALSLNYIPITNCSGTAEPGISIANLGIETLTNLEVHYSVNGGAEQVYNWSGDISFLQSEEIVLPEITFDVLSDNYLTAYTSNPNGNPDTNPANDTVVSEFGMADQTEDALIILMKLDNKPEETTWEVTNGAGEVLKSGGPYPGQPATIIKDTVYLTEDDCISFIIYDSGNDGICCENGNGLYKLSDESGNELFMGGEFGNVDIVQVYNDHITGIKPVQKTNEISVFPNPFSGNTNVNVALDRPGDVKVHILNTIGETVYSNVWRNLDGGDHILPVRTGEMEPGMYLISVTANGEIRTVKANLIR